MDLPLFVLLSWAGAAARTCNTDGPRAFVWALWWSRDKFPIPVTESILSMVEVSTTEYSYSVKVINPRGRGGYVIYTSFTITFSVH